MTELSSAAHLKAQTDGIVISGQGHLSQQSQLAGTVTVLLMEGKQAV